VFGSFSSRYFPQAFEDVTRLAVRQPAERNTILRMRTPAKFVLLVDDDPADRKLFARYLEKLGLKVVAAGDADKAVAQIVEGNVGCIITDQSMKPSGHELLQIVKSVRSDIQIIFLSGADEPSQPLPPEIRFIRKSDTQELGEAVFSVHGALAAVRSILPLESGATLNSVPASNCCYRPPPLGGN
jgi:CheY-like chemotaxis protein